ncbi:MAG: flavodoxin family protein [Candidatus Brocadiia bacterium]
MKITALYGSPRAGGNTDILMDEFLRGVLAVAPDADIKRLHVRDLNIYPCTECNACFKTGDCVFDDDMTGIYGRLLESDMVVLAAPVFFYGLPSQLKALVDRTQALWARKHILKQDLGRKRAGFFISAGGTKGQSLFDGVKLTAKYFFDAINVEYKGERFYQSIDNKGDIRKHPTALPDVFESGKSMADSTEP